jgi:5-methylcytosine-specific restriction endonuclease McrA
MRKTPIRRKTPLGNAARRTPLRKGNGLRPVGETKRKKRARYAAYLKSPEWKAKRKACLERADHTCEQAIDDGYRGARCWSRATQVHHKTYARFGGNELPEDLMALCKEHHDRIEATQFPHRKRGGPEHISAVVKRVMEDIT